MMGLVSHAITPALPVMRMRLVKLVSSQIFLSILARMDNALYLQWVNAWSTVHQTRPGVKNASSSTI